MDLERKKKGDWVTTNLVRFSMTLCFCLKKSGSDALVKQQMLEQKLALELEQNLEYYGAS